MHFCTATQKQKETKASFWKMRRLVEIGNPLKSYLELDEDKEES